VRLHRLLDLALKDHGQVIALLDFDHALGVARDHKLVHPSLEEGDAGLRLLTDEVCLVCFDVPNENLAVREACCKDSF